MTGEAGVPEWCAFFDADEYELFCGWVDDALSCFGADGQDLDEGVVELAAGADVAIHGFPLARLAQRCKDSPQDEWNSLCFSQIDAWAESEAQYEWLERASLDEVRGRLRPRLGRGYRRFEGSTADDPAEIVRGRLAPGLWVTVVAEEIPSEYDDEPLVEIEVHTAAMRAWGLDPNGLIGIALDNLRGTPLPAWQEYTAKVAREDTGEQVPVALAAGSGRTAAAWALLLAELFPEQDRAGFVVGVPARHRLILCPVPDPAVGSAIADLVARLARDEMARTEIGAVVSSGAYWYRDGRFSVLVPPEEGDVEDRRPVPATPPTPHPELDVEVADRQADEVLASWLAKRRAGFAMWAAAYADLGGWDFSVDSLDGLESLVRGLVVAVDDLVDPANREVLQACAWYLGEVMIRARGGEWRYDGSEPIVDQPWPHGESRSPMGCIVYVLGHDDTLRAVVDRFG
jgi:hypothetical protein